MQFSSGLTHRRRHACGVRPLRPRSELFKKVGQFDEIAVAAKPDVTDAELVGQIEPILPRDGAGEDGQRSRRPRTPPTRTTFISFLRGFLLAFAGIALFVGSFVIANSLSITIAQRTREFATLADDRRHEPAGPRAR